MYTGGLTMVQSHTQSRQFYHHISISRPCPWEASRVGKASRVHIPCTGRKWGGSNGLGLASRSN